MYFDMSSYSAGVSGPMWPTDVTNWYQNDRSYQQDRSWNQWGPSHDQSMSQKAWSQSNSQKAWGSIPSRWSPSKAWGQEKSWGDDENVWGNRGKWANENQFYGSPDYSLTDYNSFQVLDTRLARQAAASLGNLREEPDEVLVVNSFSSGAYFTLLADAAAADFVGFDAEWAPDHTADSDNPISVLQLAFPRSRRVYVLQLNRMGNKLPPQVQMMLVNPEVRKLGFAVDTNDRKKMATSGIAVTNGSVTDIQEPCARALGLSAGTQLSLKNAAFGLLGLNMDKDKRISCSDWASKDLTPQQVRYAALDAWVPLRLCYMLS